MAIEIRCSNGHTLRVKDECAGRSGLCPHCHTRVQVPATRPIHEDDPECVLDSPQHPEEGEEIYVFRQLYNSSTSLGSSGVLKKVKVCQQCGKLASYSFSECPRCGTTLSIDIVESVVK